MASHRLASLILLILGLGQLADPSRADDPRPAYERKLNEAQAKRVAELENQIGTLVSADKYSDALKLAEEIVGIRTIAQGKDHWETVSARYLAVAMGIVSKLPAGDRAAYGELARMADRVNDLEAKAQHADAELIARQALAICVKTLGEEHPVTAACYNSVGMNLAALGKYEEARPLLKRALAIREKALGEEHPTTAESYHMVGLNLDNQGKHVQAWPLHHRALAIRKKTVGEEDPKTAVSYTFVAYNLHAQGKQVEAQPLHERALEIRKGTLGEEHPDTANSYNNLAASLDSQGKHDEAQPLHERALAVRKKTLGEEHPRTATSYDNLASNLDDQGKHAEAQPLYKRALAIREKTLGTEHPNTAGSYNNLASNLDDQGKHAEAQPFYERALAIHKKTLGEEHPNTATGYNNVAYSLDAQGKHAEAHPFYERALAIHKKTLGDEHPRTATSYANLASNLDSQAKHAEAQLLNQRALAIRKKTLGVEHADTVTSYNNVASNLDIQGKHSEAQQLYERATAILTKTLGEEHPSTATGYNNVASNLAAQGKHTLAQPLYQRSLEIRKKSLGEYHPDTTSSYWSIASNILIQGNPRAAIPLLDSAARTLNVARLQAAKTGFERGQFRSQYDSPTATLACVLAELQEPLPAWQQAEAYLARGLLDDLDPASRRSPEAPARLAKLDELLVPLLSRSNLSDEERQRREQLQTEAAAIRKSLIEAAAVRSAKRLWPLERVQAALAPDAALVIWLDVRQFHWACIVRKSGQPIWQRLPGSGTDQAWTQEEVALTKRAHELALSQTSHPERDRLLASLRVQRLDPILTHLHGIHTLLVVPVGDMAKIPVEALTDRFLVSYTPSGSLYAQRKQQHRPISGSSLLALGDPNYRAPDTAMPTPPSSGILITQVVPGGNADKHGLQAGDILTSYNNKPLKAREDLQMVAASPPVAAEYWSEGKAKRVRLDPGKLGIFVDQRPVAEGYAAWHQGQYTQVASSRGGYDALPGTKVEVESLARMIPQSKLLLGSEASEQSLEALAEAGALKKYRLLHFATHGEVNEGIPTASALILAQDRIPRKLDDQIARVQAGKRPLEGRLTVGTILEKWDLDADQVVLSACETGLGANAGGDGMLGFAQALLQKGARSVVMSRWKVPDAATALLMKRYYENILGKRAGLSAPMGRAAGLREAKTWLRGLTQAEIENEVLTLPNSGELRGVKGSRPLTEAAKDKPFAPPYYWAAFVLVGDPD